VRPTDNGSGRQSAKVRDNPLVIDAVIFDLDGVLIDSEQLWDQARRETVAEHAGQWPPDATRAMQGMSSKEWSEYLKEHADLDLSTDQIIASVIDQLLRHYRQDLPLSPGAVGAVRRISKHWPIGLASSSNREVIDEVLRMAGLAADFAATVSSEEVPRGKPAPDVYFEAARRLGALPSYCAAVEDSRNGILSAASAAMCVLVLPNPHYPPPRAAVDVAALVLSSLDELTPETVVRADRTRQQRIEERVDEAEIESFPASDPHADWAGPA
jgi:HAD superfamily hydrolase (TIGR01509 family)